MFKQWRQYKAEKRRVEIETIIGNYLKEAFVRIDTSIYEIQNRISVSELKIPPKQLVELFTMVLAIRGDFVYKLAQMQSEEPPTMAYFYESEKMMLRNMCKKSWEGKSQEEIEEIINMFYGKS